MEPPQNASLIATDGDAADLGFAESYWRTPQALGAALPDLSPGDVDDPAFRLLADNLPTLCWLANGDGYIVWYNSRWHDYCGTTPERMEGWGWTDVHDPELLPAVMERWREAVATGEPFEMTFPLRGADGVFRPFLTRIAPVRDATNRVVRWCGVNVEIGDQVAAEQSLRAERDRYERVLNGMGEGFVLMDREFRILEINDEGMRAESRARGEIVGRVHWDAYPNTHDSELGRLYRRAMTERTPVGLEHLYRWPDGRETWFEMRAYPVAEGLAVFYRDVTGRHRADETLRDTSRRLDAVLNNTRMAVFLMDERQHCVFANAAAEKLTGYSFAQMQGRPLHDVVHHKRPDGSHYPLEECPIDRAFPERAQMEGEELFVAPDGSFYPVAFTASPVLDDEGRPVGTVIEARDVTQEKAREATLRESEARFRNMADHAPVMMWVTDVDGYCTYLNQAWYDFTGQAVEQAEGLGWLDATHPDDKTEAERAFLEANARREPFRVEYRLRRADGAYRWAIDAASPRFGPGGEYLGYVGSVIDIDERREIEERQRASEAQLRAVFDTVPVGIVMAEAPSGRIVGGNAQAERIFGHPVLPSPDVQGYGDYVSHHPDGRAVEPGEYPLAQVIQRGADRAELEVLYRRGDGRDAWIRLIAAPIRDGGGRVSGGVVASLDIDREKRAEAELRDLADTLEQRVFQAVTERENAEEALRQAQKMEAVGQLTGGIAHDFNNLLTIVIGNIDMGRRALEQAGGDPRTRRALDGAQKGAERAAALTQRLLAFSRRQPLAPKPTDVDRLVLGMSDLLNRALGETVKLEIVTSPGLWRVEVDPNQLENAILNLAVNARDAMPRGGDLTIETANARLDDGYSAQHAEVAPGNYVVISVTDTGQGMPKSVLDRVFDPFFTTKEVGKGTGLGLSQVYGFVKQSGGHVKLYSEEGRGTGVKLYLPRLAGEGAPEEEATLTRGVESSPRQETILVVEDDDDVRAYTVECLRELRYRVLEAHDGPSALRLLERQEEPVALLFTDVVMPGMSGAELAAAARELQGDLKVLYTSGYTRNAIVHGGRLDPGVEMIAKPFTFETLAQKVRDMLDQGRTRRVLVVEDEPTVRALAVEALNQDGYAADEAANAAEALGKVRAAQGRYDVVLLDAGLPDQAGEAVAAELRALYADLPVLIASGERAEELRTRFADDRCTAIVSKPYTVGRLAEALRTLGVECGKANGR